MALAALSVSVNTLSVEDRFLFQRHLILIISHDKGINYMKQSIVIIIHVLQIISIKCQIYYLKLENMVKLDALCNFIRLQLLLFK